MEKKNSDLDFFESVAVANNGVSVADVKKVFVWYDLLGYALPFQLIFILIAKINVFYYPFTMLSVLFTLIIDSVLKNSLQRDGKNFEKFNKHMSLVKLWTIPLITMGTVTTVTVLITFLGLI